MFVVMDPTVPLSLHPTLFRTCRVLANRKRLEILALLIQQPNQTVSVVATHLRLSLPAASQYLRALEARGLLTCRRVGSQVQYRAGIRQGAAGELVQAVRLAVRHRGQPGETLFKLATAFTHPRRVEIFRALRNGADSFVKLQAATHISARALSRHLSKLEARGFLKVDKDRYSLAHHKHPFGRALARSAG